jgi:hypothetical protein
MSFLVETYRARGDHGDPPPGPEPLIERAVAGLREAGSAIDFVGGVDIPGDETTFYLFEAGSKEIVEEAIRRSGLVAERVVEAIASELFNRVAGSAGDGGHTR